MYLKVIKKDYDQTRSSKLMITNYNQNRGRNDVDFEKEFGLDEVICRAYR